jgi:hypothetical protein
VLLFATQTATQYGTGQRTIFGRAFVSRTILKVSSKSIFFYCFFNSLKINEKTKKKMGWGKKNRFTETLFLHIWVFFPPHKQHGREETD